jgi:tRNA1Val (adenine37-N6)-methyltransferase
MAAAAFHFKKFSLDQSGAAHPVGTDGVLLGAWVELGAAGSVLDIGTGTGLVALMLAQRSAGAAAPPGIWAIDLHPASAECARRNAAASPWAGRLQVACCAVQDFVPSQSPDGFGLIVSNPPFFSETTKSPDALRNLGRHTDSLPFSDLLASVLRLLAPGGLFAVVLPYEAGRRLCEMAVPMGLYPTRELLVRGRPARPVERLLLQFERQPLGFRRETLAIYTENGGGYSEEYRALTADFYLK